MFSGGSKLKPPTMTERVSVVWLQHSLVPPSVADGHVIRAASLSVCVCVAAGLSRSYSKSLFLDIFLV